MISSLDSLSDPAILSLQPIPVQTLRAALTGRDGVSYTMLVRRWSAATVGRCRLCRHCTVKVGADYQAVCIVAVEGEVAEAAAPLFSTVEP